MRVIKIIAAIMTVSLAVIMFQVNQAQALSLNQNLGAGSGTITQLDQFTSTSSPSTAITQRIFGKAFRLSGQSTGCAQFDSNGILTSNGSACGSGSGGSGTVSTSTNETAGRLSYWTTTSGTPPLLGEVATTTLTASGVLSLSNTVAKVGGSNSVLTLTGGTNGQILSWLGGIPTWTATTTFTGTAPVTTAFASGQVTVACPTCLTANQTITLSGAVTGSGSTAITTAFGSQSAGVLGTPATGIPSMQATSTLYGPVQNGKVLAGLSGSLQYVATTTYSSGLAYLAGNVTNTLTAGDGLTRTVDDIDCDTASGSVFGCLSSADWTTFNAKESVLTFTTPLMRSTNTINWVGLATTTQPSSSNLLVSNGGAGVYGVATTSETCSTGITCTAHAVLGGGGAITLATINAGVLGSVINGTVPTSQATSTLYGTGVGGQVLGWNNTTGGLAFVATSTGGGTPGGTQGQLQYNGAGPAFAGVSTTTLTLGTGLSYSGTLGSLVGGAAGSLTIATSSLYSGTTGQFPYFSGTNTLTATSSIFLSTLGNIGIGTTNPVSRLTVNATTTASETVARFNNSNGTMRFQFNLESSGASSLTMYDNGNNADIFLNTVTNGSSYINNGGNVGIGTTTPSSLLSVHGTSYVSGTSFFGGAITATSSAYFATAGGSVGIGTASPLGSVFTTIASTSVSALKIQDGFGTSVLNVNTASTTGPLFAIFATTSTATSCGVAGGVCLFSVDQYGHIAASSTVPVLSSCGTSPSLSADSSDAWGTITVGSVAATGCTLTFGSAHTIGTHCNITNQNMSVVNAMTYTESLTGFVVSQTGLTSSKLDYFCAGQ